MDAGNTGTAARLMVATLGGLIAVAGTATAVQAAPQIESTRLDSAVAGRQAQLRIRAVDAQAPVTGLVVGFGRGESGFGLSACLPADSAGRLFAPVAAPGRRVTLFAPHEYATPGSRRIGARVTSAGCTGGQPSTVQRLVVKVAPRGQAPRPIQILPPRIIPLGQPIPALPGLGSLPLSRADIPLPALAPPAPVRIAAACPGSYQRFRATRAGERAARSALLCLLNRERRRRGLRAVRGNGRLVRAAVGHSRTMVRRRFFAHVGPGSLDLAARLRMARYIPRRGGTWLIGENIGFGRGRMSRPVSMHRAWMRSTPHRAAMLDRRFHEVGIGPTAGSPYGRRGATFTVDFGYRR